MSTTSMSATTKTTKRTISLVLVIEDHEAAKPIWEHHLNNQNVLGGKIVAIGNGNIFHERDRLEEKLNTIAEVAERSTGLRVADDILDIIDEIPS